MSRISRIDRLQRGQLPRFNQSSLEHTLQNVCPHGINAAPFFLPMHTQHTVSFPTVVSVITPSPPPPPSVLSSNSLINDTLNGVPVKPTFAVPTSVTLVGSMMLLPASLNCLSAAKAAAKFIPEECCWFGLGFGSKQPGSETLSSSSWPVFTTASISSRSSSISRSSLVTMVVGLKPQVAPQQPKPLSPSRSLRLILLDLLLEESTPSIWSPSNARIVIASLSGSGEEGLIIIVHGSLVKSLL